MVGGKIMIFAGGIPLKKGGKVEVTDAAGKKTDFEATNIIVATGARSRELPALPIDGKKIIGYREALVLEQRPQKLLVVGSGAIGVEFAYFYFSMGAKVTIVEKGERLIAREDEEVSAQIGFAICKLIGSYDKDECKRLCGCHNRI